MEKQKSVLHMDKIIFDKIEFRRLGLSSDQELEIELNSGITQKQDEEVYKVTLVLKGNKPGEYIFEICLTGFFVLEGAEELSMEVKKALVTRNTTAILMPYLRSEVSLLTAQPGMECVVLPAFNVNSLLQENDGNL